MLRSLKQSYSDYHSWGFNPFNAEVLEQNRFTPWSTICFGGAQVLIKEIFLIRYLSLCLLFLARYLSLILSTGSLYALLLQHPIAFCSLKQVFCISQLRREESHSQILRKPRVKIFQQLTPPWIKMLILPLDFVISHLVW